jgi:hypothetical protein
MDGSRSVSNNMKKSNHQYAKEQSLGSKNSQNNRGSVKKDLS